jgi:DNA-directed RNA polymerase subunit N (RpoN/RPB10)
MRSSVYLTVNKLLRHEAISEESAKTLDELGINVAKVKRCLMSGSQLKSIVAQVGETKMSYEEYREKVRENKRLKKKEPVLEKIDFQTAKFYIRRDQINSARELSFKSRSVVLNTVLFCALTTTIMVCLVFLMPEILNLINGFLG